MTDWTRSSRGRSNDSEAFNGAVIEVGRLLEGVHLGDSPRSAATLIVAQLAHRFDMAPSKDGQRRLEDISILEA